VQPGEAMVVASDQRCRAEFGFGYIAAVWVAVSHGRALVSVAPALEDAVRQALAPLDPGSWASEAAAEALRSAADPLIRDLYPQARFRPHRGQLLWCSEESWRDCGVTRCTALTDDTDPVVQALPEAGLPHGWCTFQEGTAFGVIEGGRLLATACTMPIEYLTDQVGDVGAVFTVPDRRREGLASACVSAVARAVLDSGRLPTYRVAQSNVASQRTAGRAGFRHHADQLVLAVSTDEGPP